ncbi:hypothetical protein GCM10007904_20940 [Oharaeibacter diazotrophicus]|nr:hypothetical protein GCM10007904_20940 [Oharaeibacter diazotrophicus]
MNSHAIARSDSPRTFRAIGCGVAAAARVARRETGVSDIGGSGAGEGGAGVVGAGRVGRVAPPSPCPSPSTGEGTRGGADCIVPARGAR